MKKLLTIAALASAAAASAVEIEVGTVGVTEITPAAQNTIVATSYNELDGSGAMAVSNIVKTGNLPVGTKLYALKGANAYEGYTLTFVSGSSGPKYWARDNNYTVSAAGVLSGGTASSETTKQSLSVGQGFWISLPSAPTTEKIYVYGKPPATTNITMTANSVVLVGNPTQSDKTPTITGMVKGDKIMVFVGASTTPTTYTTNGSSWRNANKDPGLPTITAGTGFWYISKGTATINWN